MKHNYENLGKYLRTQREKVGMSQLELGTQLGYGNAQFVSNWERGLASPPPKIIRKLIQLLNIPEKTILNLIIQEQKRFWVSHLRKGSKDAV